MKQSEALNILESGANVLLTGPAGSGKTFLLNKYISRLKENKIGVAITASTGIAATHIGGRTIHSWAGIGIKDKLSSKDISSLKKKAYLKKQFEKTAVLLIDEISMLAAHRLDMVNKVCQAFLNNSLPFGGLQIVMSGDFFQLPPIGRDNDFVYKSKIWSEMDLQVCYLEEQYRHSDKAMAQVLESLRQDDFNLNTLKLLQKRMNLKSQDKTLKLFTHNIDVDTINQQELAKLDAREAKYLMQGTGDKKILEALKKNCLAPEELVLKVGAQVMFVKNKFSKDKTVYVNGTQGVVTAFAEQNYPVVKLNSGEEILVSPDSWTVDDELKILAKITQLPLRLAWAITVHKSQGMTLERAEMDLSHCFSYGMGYVALSRLTSLKGLYLLGINEMAYKLDPEVFIYDKELRRLSKIAQANPPKKQASLI